MKLSTKGRYAVTAMLDLALNSNTNHRVTLADISEFQGISLSYLEQLFARLRKAKLVKGTRGPGGGYRLGKPADEISIANIISAIDDRPTKQKHITLEPNSKHIATEELWAELSYDIFEFLDQITLATLVERRRQGTLHSATKPAIDLEEPIDGAWDSTPTSQPHRIM